MRHPANETDRAVGRRLRTLRLARGLSQSEFGTHLGVTYQQIQKYEAGTNRIAASRLSRAAALFGVDPADLFADQFRPPADALIAFVSGTEAVELNRAFFRISERRTRARIIKLVIAMADSSEGSA